MRHPATETALSSYLVASSSYLVASSKWARVTRLTRAVGMVVLTFGLVAGCDSKSSSSDKQVRTQVSAAPNAQSNDAMISQLKAAADMTDASPGTAAIAKAALARAEFAQAMTLVNTVSMSQIELQRLAVEIEQARTSIDSGNTLVAAYTQLDPAVSVSKINAMIAAATGQGADGFWISEGDAKIPTLSALKQQISQFQQQEATLVAKLADLTQQRSTALDQGEQFTRKSLEQKGEESVKTYTEGSTQRRTAAGLAIEIDQANASLVPVRADLGVAKQQLEVVQQVVDQLASHVKSINTGWAAKREQIDAQAASIKRIAQGTGDKDDASITSKSAAFDKLAKTTSDVTDTAVSLLNDAARHYGEAAKLAETLKTDLKSRLSDPKNEKAPEAVAWNAALATIDPVLYKTQQAVALQTVGSVYAGRASTLATAERLSKALDATYKPAGLTVPAEFANVLPDPTTKARADAEEAYKAGGEILAGIVESSPKTSPGRMASVKVERALGLFGRSQLAMATGDSTGAASLMSEAASITSQISEVPLSSLPELPAAIKPKPAPVEAPAPAPAPAVAPAPAAPVEQ